MILKLAGIIRGMMKYVVGIMEFIKLKRASKM